MMMEVVVEKDEMEALLQNQRSLCLRIAGKRC
jgi:hypothetical protein